MPILSNRKLAYSLTVLAYRECNPLEDHHSAMDSLSMEIYNEIYEAVRNKMNEYRQCVNAMKMEQEDFLKYYESSDRTQKDYAFYFMMIAKGIHQWMPAKAYSGKISDDIVEYMLAGTFHQYCIEGVRMDNAAMKEMNIDVHNRVYTLICKGRI